MPTAAIIAALVDLGIRLEPVVAEALAAWIEQMARDHRSPTFAEVARAVVVGINRDYSDDAVALTVAGAIRHDLAFAAIKRTRLDDGTLPTDSQVNRAIEMFVTLQRGEA